VSKVTGAPGRVTSGVKLVTSAYIRTLDNITLGKLGFSQLDVLPNPAQRQDAWKNLRGGAKGPRAKIAKDYLKDVADKLLSLQ